MFTLLAVDSDKGPGTLSSSLTLEIVTVFIYNSWKKSVSHDDLIAQAWTAHAATIEQIKLILSNFQKQLQNTSIKWTMNAREDGGDLESGRVS